MDELLLKYIREKVTPAEIRTVEDWITSSEENQQYYNRLKARHLAGTFELTAASVDAEQELADFKASHHKESDKRIWALFSKPSLPYAAAIILLVGFAGWFLLSDRNMGSGAPPANAITLQTDDGTITIVPGNSLKTIRGANGEVIGQQMQDRLVYHNGKTNNSSQISYNTLTVPYGKRFSILLSDGSTIFLNSGSSIRYPVNFPEDGNREVSIKGEAFFEIASDPTHPFIVDAGGINVRVLGTKFNVTAYEEDATVQTVLVEGSVGLYEGENYDQAEKTLLTPGHKASWDKLDHDIDVAEAEISIYTSWIKGEMVFKHMKLNAILKKLERQYRVEIIQPEDAIGNMRFTASFNDKQSITEILDTFKEHYGIEYHRRNDGKIIIKSLNQPKQAL